MNNQDAYPLCWPEGWPRTPSDSRKWGHFEGTLDQVRRSLLDEVDRIALGAESRTHTVRDYVIISSNYPLRRDGGIHAGAKEPSDPGVAVYFKRKGKQVCFACDKYDRVWKNIRAIQKTIEAMRGIERWGSSTLLDRAFSGFMALPEKTTPSCWDVLGITPDATETAIREAYRTKAKFAHPDAGGTHEAFTALNDAKDVALASIK